MALWILRTAFVIIAAGVGIGLINSGALQGMHGYWTWIAFVLIVTASIGIIAVDVLVPRKRIDTISAVYFGIIVGLVLTNMVMVAIEPMLQNAVPSKASLQLGLAVALCYICISLLLQTKNDFRFVIPYVEFSKEVKGLKPYILDTSVVIDGRIADVVETNVLDNQILMPRFVLSELQGIADSSDKMRRSRGRRGLDILNRLRTHNAIDFKIYDRDLPELAGQPVDMKLVLLAKHLGGKVVTNDYNLNKVARLHNVPVINLNDIANALKPVFLPGEQLNVRVVKPGEGVMQGVGYLDDGTMVVIEGGRDHLQQNVMAAVTSVLQTSAGRMIFAKYESTLDGEDRSDSREQRPNRR
ncbi:MAG: PIN/TRAM domain-containing protein [Planctomycetales bacterium]|nr:PIN/TRAM domain-containing protein [Planctomycetales bacterium]MCA9161765.1 PIN/TRAM domain-containing protein [Planctomycetales bacterium]